MQREDSTRPRTRSSRPLVSTPISQQITFQLYHFTVKLLRPFHGKPPTPPPRSDTSITGFSEKSRARLRFVALNAGPLLRSQFGLTYGAHWPADGRQFKADLNAFLVALRRAFPFLLYLWIAEFQRRGAPHVHLFPNIQPTPENRRLISDIWCRIVDAPDKANMLKVHDNSLNFIPWDMGNGSYLCKYLAKAAQKSIPPGFLNFGRFWGNSRGLIAAPDIMTASEINALFPGTDPDTGEIHDADALKFITRTLGRYHERQFKRSYFRHTNRSASVMTGAPVFRQALEYLLKSRQVITNPEPF